MTPASSNAVQRLIGMVRSPRATLTGVIANPRSLDLAILVLVLSTVCSVGFLLTRVGELAALDQQVRQLESFGTVVTDDTYADLRRLVPYRPLISAFMILVGWPVLWLAGAAVLQALGNRFAESLPRHSDGPQEARRRGRYAQVLTIVVHASAIFAVRALIAAPINYARESLGGATSLSLLMPSFGESTFAGRLLGAVDIFVLWWAMLVAMGMSILYETRTLAIARWLVGAYAAGAVVLALTQALRGGI